VTERKPSNGKRPLGKCMLQRVLEATLRSVERIQIWISMSVDIMARRTVAGGGQTILLQRGMTTSDGAVGCRVTMKCIGMQELGPLRQILTLNI
jgi:hypothetical protein